MRAAVTLVCRPFFPRSSTGGHDQPSMAGPGPWNRAWVSALPHACSPFIPTRRPWGTLSPRWRPPWQPTSSPAPHPLRRLRVPLWKTDLPGKRLDQSHCRPRRGSGRHKAGRQRYERAPLRALLRVLLNTRPTAPRRRNRVPRAANMVTARGKRGGVRGALECWGKGK